MAAVVAGRWLAAFRTWRPDNPAEGPSRGDGAGRSAQRGTSGAATGPGGRSAPDPERQTTESPCARPGDALHARPHPPLPRSCETQRAFSAPDDGELGVELPCEPADA